MELSKLGVSVVIPALNEEKGVVLTIRDFLKLEIVKEIIVVDNGSTDQTAMNALLSGARVINEPVRGYGSALLAGINNAKYPIIILCEADNSFYADDVNFFIPYLNYFDMVKGGRSIGSLISNEADYGALLRWGNFLLAKFQSLLYFGINANEFSNFRDMGGTFRIIKQDSFKKINGLVTSKDSAFLADLTSLYLRNKLSVLEIPIRYRVRVGISKITGNKLTAIKLGFRMLLIILRNRISSKAKFRSNE